MHAAGLLPILVGAGQCVDREPPDLRRSPCLADMAAEWHAGAGGDLAGVVDVPATPPRSANPAG